MPPTYEVVFNHSLAGAPDGMYTLATAIIESRNNKPIQLSFEGQTEQGYYALGSVELQNRVIIPGALSELVYLPIVN